MSRCVITIGEDRRFAICVRPLSLALKWLCPAFRAISLPFLVTLIRFEKDLFVFMFDFLSEIMPRNRPFGVARLTRGAYA